MKRGERRYLFRIDREEVLCRRCGFKPSNDLARFCSRCGSEIVASVLGDRSPVPLQRIVAGRSGRARPRTVVTWLARLMGISQWLADASDTINSPILGIPRLSERAKLVYIYLAGIVYAFGSSHSRLSTIAKCTGLSSGAARKAISELEWRGFLSHRTRKTWHGRGAHAYRVKRVR